MTTVERYPPQFEPHSDAPSSLRQPHSSSNAIVRRIPPAVPSPPRLYTTSSPPRKPHIITEHPPTFKMASEESSQWLFTENEVLSAPSIIDGIPPQEERCRRAKGVNFIIQAGILLKLPQLTLATAAVFFQRFYMRKSMVPEKMGVHHYNIAATALFLATKTEENCRKTKEIVIAVAKVAQKNASLIIDDQSKEYWRWRDSILLYEELMLELLTFDVVLQSPYTLLYDQLQKLQIEDNKPLRNVAWAFLNDSCLTTLCLLMPAKDVAIGAIYFAAKFLGDTIPDDENGNPWWEMLGGEPDKIVRAVSVLSEFWSDNPLKRTENPYGESASSGDDLDRTRRRGSDGSSMVGSSPDAPSTNGAEPKTEPASSPIKRKNDDEEDGAIEEPVPKRLKSEEAFQ
ncbi:cyclin-like protein [Stipitochalara longipes BDJ]|nr:cyclin-like protein [Stipitochalara longipes BDJ]